MPVPQITIFLAEDGQIRAEAPGRGSAPRQKLDLPAHMLEAFRPELETQAIVIAADAKRRSLAASAAESARAEAHAAEAKRLQIEAELTAKWRTLSPEAREKLRAKMSADFAKTYLAPSGYVNARVVKKAVAPRRSLESLL